MSKNVDEKVVKMRFDNTNFEKGVSSTISSIKNLKENLKFSNITTGIEQVALKIPGIGTVLDQTLRNMTNSVTGFVKNTMSQFSTLGNMQAGYKEYETQINAVQTILANTQWEGTNIDDVNASLDELNTYADKTIYNFTEMTKNIGTFTAAGVDLQTSTEAIKGIANLAAMSGSTSQQASTAMYQLSQALAAGKVNLQDWNSVVNAGMGGKVFQDALKETAYHMGVVVDESMSFRESISERGQGWLTSDILLETLRHFAGAFDEASLKAEGYSDAEIAELYQLAETAEDSATKVKTLTQLIDTLKESLQSGWTQSWEFIIGDFEEAKETWTKISDTIQGLLQPSTEARNSALEYWAKGEGLTEEEMEKVTEAQKKTYDILVRTAKGEFGNGKARFKAFEDMGFDAEEMQEFVNEYMDGMIETYEDVMVAVDKVVDLSAKGPTGREMFFEGLTNIATTFLNVLEAIGGAFREVFPRTTGEQLTSLSEKFRDLTYSLNVLNNDQVLQNIASTAKILFSVLGIGTKILKGIFSVVGQVVGAITGKAGSLSVSFMSASASVGEALAAFNEWLDEAGVISGFFQKIGDTISKFVTGVKNAFKSVYEFIKNNLDFSGLKDKMEELGNDIKSFFDKLTGKDKKKGAKKPADGAKKDLGEEEQTKSDMEALLSSGANMGDLVQQIIGGSGLDKAAEAFSNFGDSIDKVWGNIKKVFSDIWGTISPTLTKIEDGFKEFFGKVDFKSVLSSVQKVGIIGVLTQVRKVLKNISGMFESKNDISKRIEKLLKTLSNSINDFSDSIKKTLAKNATSKMLLSFAGSVAILAAAIALLGILPIEVITQGAIGLTVVVIEIVAAVRIMNKLKIKNLAKTLIALGIAVALFAVSVKVLSKISGEGLLKGLGSIIVLLYVLVKLMQDFKKMKLEGVAATIIALAVAINMLVIPVLLLGLIPWKVLGKGLAVVGVMIVGLVIALKLLQLNIKGIFTGPLKGIAPALLALAVAVNALVVPVLLFGIIPTDKLIQGIAGIAVVIGVLVAALWLLSKFDAKKAVLPMLALVVAVDLLVGTIVVISALMFLFPPIIVGFIGLIAIIAVFAASLKAIGKAVSKNIGPIIAGILVMAAAMLAMMYAIYQLKDSDPVTLAVAMGGLCAIMILFAASLFIISKAGEGIQKNIAGVIVGIVLLAAGITAIGFAVAAMVSTGVDWETLIVAFAGLAGMMIAMAGAMYIMGKAVKKMSGDDVATIAVMIALLTASLILLVNCVLIPLSSLSLEQVGIGLLGMAGALAAIVLAIGGLAFIATKMNSKALPNLKAFAAVLTAIGIAGAGIALLIASIMDAITAINEMEISPAFLMNIVIIGTALTQILTQALISTIETILSFIPDVVMTLLSVIDLFLSGLNERMGSILESLFGILKQILVALCGFIQDNIQMFVDTVMAVFVAVLKGIDANIYDIVTLFISIMCHMIDAAADKIDDVIDSMLNYIDKLASTLMEKKEHIAKSISDLLLSVLETAFEIVFGKEGIIAKLPAFGKKLIAGILGGIIDAFNTGAETIGKMLDNLLQSLVDWLADKLHFDAGEVTLGSTIASKIHIDKPGWITEALDGALAKGGTIKSNGKFLVGENGPELLSTQMGKTQVTPLTHQNTRSVLDNYAGKTDHRLADIADSLDSINSGFNNYKTSSNKIDYDDSGILAKMDNMEKTMSALGNRLDGMAVIIDSKALVGQIAKPMDGALGKIAQRKVR